MDARPRAPGRDGRAMARGENGDEDGVEGVELEMARAYEDALGRAPREGTVREARAYAGRALARERGEGLDGSKEEMEAKCARVAMISRYLSRALEKRAGVGEEEDARDALKTRADFDVLVRELSAAYARYRGDDDSNVSWCPPSTFERRTVKYWVHPRDVVPLQLEILKRLPILDFRDQRVGKDDREKDQRDVSDRSMITSVYLDNSNFEVYRSRLVRDQGATLVRCRWYGGGRWDDVFIERKTHHESWSGEKSVKERVKTSRATAVSIFDGHTPLRDLPASDSDLINEVRSLEIDRRNIKPVLMTKYRRTAFQRSDGNQIRISIDTELQWRDVRDLGTRAISKSSLHDFSPPFAYAVLEVKLSCSEEEELMEWIDEVTSTFDVIQVHKFSKFLHGCAMHFPRDALHTLPHWYAIQMTVGAKARAHSEKESPDLDIERTESSSSFSELLRTLTSAVVCRQKAKASLGSSKKEDEGRDDVEAPEMRRRHMPVKVEPKTFFANERTLLQWLSMSILLLFLALGLMAVDFGGGDGGAVPFADASNASYTMRGHSFAGAVCGMIIAPIAILFMLYALWTYMVRAWRIARREPSTRYDDVFGPVALVAILVVVATTAVILSAISVDWNNVRYDRL